MHEWSIEAVKSALQEYQNTHSENLSEPHDQNKLSASASVLILLVEEGDALSCVFIERAHNPRDIHSGQIAFPGGRAEQYDEDHVATALRETQEEIGVNVDRDDVLALLPVQISRKQYRVRPVIACINWPQQLVLQKEEVASVFTLPLTWLSNKGNLDSATVMGLPEHSTIVYKEYNNRRLWGLSAKIINDLLQIISTH